MVEGVGVIKLRAITIDELVDRFALSNQADGKSPSTVRWYTEILTSFSGYAKHKLHRNGTSVFTLEVVREYMLHLRQKPCFEGHPYTPQQDKPVSPRTVQCHVRALKAFSSWLHAEGYTTENRLKNLKLPKAPAELVQPLVSDEIEKISSVTKKESPTGFRNYSIFVTALDTGLRASEIAGILLSQLNLKVGCIKVLGKGAKERMVPIGKFVGMTLWHYIENVRPQAANGDIDELFVSRDGRPITTNTIKLVFSRLAKRSGIERLHAHLCRHTFAVNYLLNGGDIFSLREILGHTTLEMVNHYLHFTASQITDQHHKFSPMDKLKGKLD